MIRDEMEVFGTGQVRSVQSLELQQARFTPSKNGVQEAGYRYFTYLNQRFRPWIRIRYREDGGIQVRCLGLTLLAFGAPRLATGREVVAIRFPIVGGLLVQKGMRRSGELRFELRPRQLVMAVEGYYAALIGQKGSDLRRVLYERSQAAIHRRVAEEFLDEWLSRLLVR